MIYPNFNEYNIVDLPAPSRPKINSLEFCFRSLFELKIFLNRFPIKYYIITILLNLLCFIIYSHFLVDFLILLNYYYFTNYYDFT